MLSPANINTLSNNRVISGHSAPPGRKSSKLTFTRRACGNPSHNAANATTDTVDTAAPQAARTK